MYGFKKQQEQQGMNDEEVEEEQEEGYINQNGFISTFQFSDMDKNNKKVITLAKYDPKHRHRAVYPGLNFQGICRNQTCEAFEKMVWVPRHYGQFHIGSQIHELPCPICSEQLPAETVKNLGYRKCLIKVTGRKAGDTNRISWEDKQTEGKLVKFDGYEGKTAQWQYLRIKVDKL